MKAINTIILFFIINSTLFCGQWFVVDSPPYSAYFRSIDCFDSLNCVAVGIWQGSHTMARVTTDGGMTWKETLNDSIKIVKDQDTIFPTKAIEVVCKEPNLVIITATSGNFWRSSDRGFTWEKSIIPERINPDYISMHDDKFGGVVFWNHPYITYDGGITWDSLNITYNDTSDIPKGYTYISIPQHNSIILMGVRTDKLSYIIRSDDKGKTWDVMPNTELRIGYIKFLDRKTGWAVGRYKRAPMRYADAVFKTTDGGYSWVNQLDSLTSPSANGLIKLKFWDYNYGVAYGPMGHLWKTSNGGELWYRDPDYDKSVMQAELDDIAFLDSTTLVAVDTWLHRIFKYTKDTTISSVLIEKPYDVSISPNPATDFIEITLSNRTLKGVVERVRVYDVLGVCVITSPPAPLQSGEGSKLRLDVSHLQPGVYFVQIGSRVQRFVKL